MHVIAGKAEVQREALEPEFKEGSTFADVNARKSNGC